MSPNMHGVGLYVTGGRDEVQRMKEPILPGQLLYEIFFVLFGGVGAMRSGGMRRWEGNAWSMESHSGSRVEKAFAFLRR